MTTINITLESVKTNLSYGEMLREMSKRIYESPGYYINLEDCKWEDYSIKIVDSFKPKQKSAFNQASAISITDKFISNLSERKAKAIFKAARKGNISVNLYRLAINLGVSGWSYKNGITSCSTIIAKTIIEKAIPA